MLLFQPEWFQILSCALCPFSCSCNLKGSLVSLVCLRSNFVSPLPLPLLISRSRGEISCKWGRVVTARDRRSRCLPCFASQLCYLFVCCISSHSIMRIAFACFHKTCIRSSLPFLPLPSSPLLDPLACSSETCPRTRPAQSSPLGPDHPLTSIKHLRFLL